MSGGGRRASGVAAAGGRRVGARLSLSLSLFAALETPPLTRNGDARLVGPVYRLLSASLQRAGRALRADDRAVERTPR